jgi:hypothetical protein
MWKQFCLILALILALPAWSQEESNPAGGAPTADEDTWMKLPPPVSGAAYPNIVGAEERSNYLEGGATFIAAYNDNVLPGGTPKPVSDFTYFVFPTISLEEKTTRQLQSLTYSPGFRFYQRTSALDAVDQNADEEFQYRLSSRATLRTHDAFQQNSSVYDQPFALAGIVSGSAPGAAAGVIAPYANQITNDARAAISYQFALNGMIGVGGTTSLSNYPSPSQVPGLNNFMSEGGMGFYSHRLSLEQYVGGIYQYSRIVTNPVNSTTQTDALSLFYTFYSRNAWTLSLSAGPQYYSATLPSTPTSNAWAPSVSASIGWQTHRANVAASYSRSVNAGGGLLGAYNSNSANADVRWQISRAWIAGAQASYSSLKNATSQLATSYPGGHTVIGSASLQYSFGEHIRAEAGYDRLHQSYNSIALVSNSPDSNRGYISITYLFAKALGR